MIHKNDFSCEMKKRNQKSAPVFEPTDANLMAGLYEGRSFTEMLAPMLKRVVEAALSGELSAHIGSEKLEGVSNRRNGLQTKRVRTELGPIEIETSRDRNGTFEPQLIGRQERQLRNGVEQHILDLYCMGMGYRDIRAHMLKMYNTELSEGQLTHITDSVLGEMEQWRNRPLADQYAAVFFDGIRYKMRVGGQVVPVTVYAAIGVDMEGKRDVLGFYLSETESAKYWLQVFENFKARGVKDIVFICSDNLSGIGQAIEAAFPDSLQQLCIVHQIRNSCKFLVWKDRKEFCKDLKMVYTAINKETALVELGKLKEKWQAKYKYAIASWEENWDNLSNYFDYPLELRKIIYTTNTIENLNRGIRKYTKTKTQFPNENAATKSIYLSIKNIEEAWTMTIRNWGIILNQYLIIFENRCRL